MREGCLQQPVLSTYLELRSTVSTLLILLAALIPLTWESPLEMPCPNPVLSKCTCHRDGVAWVKVNCTNTQFSDVTPLHSIPTTVKEIVFTGNTIPEIYPNIMGNSTSHTGSTTSSCRKMPELTNLDLSRNRIRIIHGKAFHCMKQLEILTMNDNRWEVNEQTNTRTFSSLSRLKTLRLRNVLAPGYNRTHLKQVFIDSFVVESENENRLEEIHLEDNHLRYYHADLFCGLKNIRRIYLSRNDISTPQINNKCIQGTQLTELHLDHNNITFFSPSFMESLSNIPSLRAANFSNNPFECDCNFIASYRWLNNAQKSSFVTDKYDFTCHTPMAYENVVILKSMTELELKNVCIKKADIDHEERLRKLQTSYIILGIIFAILGVLFCAVLYLNRYKIQKKLNVHIVEPIRESMLGRNMHYGYASVSV